MQSETKKSIGMALRQPRQLIMSYYDLRLCLKINDPPGLWYSFAACITSELLNRSERLYRISSSAHRLYIQEQPSSQLIGHALSPEEPCPPRIKASTLIVWLIRPGTGEGGVGSAQERIRYWRKGCGTIRTCRHSTHQLNH